MDSRRAAPLKAGALQGGGAKAVALVAATTGLFILLSEVGPIPAYFGIAGDSLGWLRVGYFVAVSACGLLVLSRGWKYAAFFPAVSASVASLWVASLAPWWQRHEPGWQPDWRDFIYTTPADHVDVSFLVGLAFIALLLIAPVVIGLRGGGGHGWGHSQPRSQDIRLVALAACVAVVAALLARLLMPITIGAGLAAWREPVTFFTCGLAYLLGASRGPKERRGSHLLDLLLVTLLSYSALDDLLEFVRDPGSIDLTRSLALLIAGLAAYCLGLVYAGRFEAASGK